MGAKNNPSNRPAAKPARRATQERETREKFNLRPVIASLLQAPRPVFATAPAMASLTSFLHQNAKLQLRGEAPGSNEKLRVVGVVGGYGIFMGSWFYVSLPLIRCFSQSALKIENHVFVWRRLAESRMLDAEENKLPKPTSGLFLGSPLRIAITADTRRINHDLTAESKFFLCDM